MSRDKARITFWYWITMEGISVSPDFQHTQIIREIVQDWDV
jgi:hypothetical protein